MRDETNIYVYIYFLITSKYTYPASMYLDKRTQDRYVATVIRFFAKVISQRFHSCTSVFVLKIKNVIIHLYNSDIQL